MPRDYQEIIAALRRKAADKAVSPEEKEALLAKAKELEDNHRVTDDTTPKTYIYNLRGERVTYIDDFLRDFLRQKAPEEFYYITKNPPYRMTKYRDYDLENIIEFGFEEEPDQETGDGTGYLNDSRRTNRRANGSTRIIRNCSTGNLNRRSHRYPGREIRRPRNVRYPR